MVRIAMGIAHIPCLAFFRLLSLCLSRTGSAFPCRPSAGGSLGWVGFGFGSVLVFIFVGFPWCPGEGWGQPVRAAGCSVLWTEGCIQASGVLRPMRVPSAIIQSRRGVVNSMKSSNRWTFSHPCVLQALTSSLEGHGTELQTALPHRLLNDFIPSRI